MLTSLDDDDQMVMMTALQNLDRVSSNYSTSTATAGASDGLVADTRDSGHTGDMADFASLVRCSVM